MADKKVYEIKLNGVQESIEGVSTLQDSLNRLNDTVKESGGNFKSASSSMDELAKTEQKIRQFNEEYQTALQSNKMVLQENTKAIKEKLDLERAELIVSENQRETYAQKQQLLSAMGKVIKNTAGDTSELQAQYAQLNQELKEFDSNLGNHQRNVGNYEAATVGLKQQLREMQAELASMLANGVSKADPAFVKLAKEAGKLKDAIGDAGEEVRRFASDTSKIDKVVGVATDATAAMQLYTGVMSSFGMSTEEANESIEKMVGLMSITNSLKQLSDSLQSGSVAGNLFSKSMDLLTNSFKGASTGAKALKLALASIGIGLIMIAVDQLTEHWEELVQWFQNTIAPVNALTSVFYGAIGAFKGFAMAAWNWVVNPLKGMAQVLQKVLSGDFEGAVDAAINAVKNQFQGTLDAFKGEFSKGMQKAAEVNAERAVKTEAEAQQKILKNQLDELEIAERNNKTYSKKYIELKQKQFDNERILAKGNADKLQQIKLDEMRFYGQVEDKKAAAIKKTHKTGSNAANEEAKRLKELQEQYEKLYEARLKYQEIDKESEKLVSDNLKRILENRLEESDSLEEKKDLLLQIQGVETGLIQIEEERKKNSVYKELAKDLSDLTTDEQELQKIIEGTSDKMSQLTELQQQKVKNARLELKNISTEAANSIEVIVDKTNKKIEKETVDAMKKSLADTQAQTELLFSNMAKSASGNTEQAKQAMLKQVEELKEQWAVYLVWLKKEFGETSAEYIRAFRQAQKEVDDANKKADNGGKDKKDLLSGKIRDLFDQLFDNVFDPINDAFSTMLDFALEEAQDALDRATEMHDESVEKITESQEKISDLNEKMKNSSGAQLEAYRQQLADEMLLMAQRESEEKRLAKEKERREKEIEKKQKQQKKLQMGQQIIESIANTALGITKALEWGFPLGTIYAAIVGSMGAIQTALITAQMAKLADGGLLVGKSHSQGGIPVGNTGIEVEGGEAVINKRSTAKYLPLLDEINAEGNGGKHTLLKNRNKFADGGTLNYSRITSSLAENRADRIIRDSIEAIDLHPVVQVVDLVKGVNQLAEVRELAGLNSPLIR